MLSRKLLKPRKKWDGALIYVKNKVPHYSLQLMIEMHAGVNPDQSDWEVAFEYIDYNFMSNDELKIVIVDDLDEPRPEPMEIPDE